jgi:predicted DNA-binding protein (UPF0251 family)
MPRPKRLRKILNPPNFKGFRPYGYYGPDKEPVSLYFEELEAIRLLDYENLSQVMAASTMNISRPTLTRIYESARRKVAIAFAEARTLIVEGGTVYFDSEWFRCLFCDSTFNNPLGEIEVKVCPVCGGNKIEHINNKLNIFTQPS